MKKNNILKERVDNNEQYSTIGYMLRNFSLSSFVDVIINVIYPSKHITIQKKIYIIKVEPYFKSSLPDRIREGRHREASRNRTLILY